MMENTIKKANTNKTTQIQWTHELTTEKKKQKRANQEKPTK